MSVKHKLIQWPLKLLIESLTDTAQRGRSVAVISITSFRDLRDDQQVSLVLTCNSSMISVWYRWIQLTAVWKLSLVTLARSTPVMCTCQHQYVGRHGPVRVRMQEAAASTSADK